MAAAIDFMRNMYRKLNLNPLNFVTLASYSWNCILKKSLKYFELLTVVNMILDYENVIRGEITRALCRYGESNKKYTQKCTCNEYLDFNLNNKVLYQN